MGPQSTCPVQKELWVVRNDVLNVLNQAMPTLAPYSGHDGYDHGVQSINVGQKNLRSKH
jgi:hypothetical protein